MLKYPEMTQPVRRDLVTLMRGRLAMHQSTNTPSSTQEFQNEIELPCLFPYYMDGKLINDMCYKFNVDTFLDPVSSCPIWNVTTKINGINNYNSSDNRLTLKGYCPGEDGITLDPEVTRCSSSTHKTPFSKCRNNCKGGNRLQNHYISLTLFSSSVPKPPPLTQKITKPSCPAWGGYN